MPSSGNRYLRVKEKGDQITFRIAQNPVYTGKHFIQKEEGWDVPTCPRINSNESCELCELYFKCKAEEKKLKEVGDEKQAKIAAQEARKYSVAVSFYFPILNRGTEEFGVLQTTMGVRNKLNTQHEAGIKVMDKDWILRNTGSENPNERYAILPVDSSDTKPFTEKEEEEFKKAQNFDLGTINEGTSDEIEG